MATINLSTKSADRLTKKCALQYSVLAGALNENYSFKGAKTVEIITPISVPMNDYNRSGNNRYGEPQEVEDFKQVMVMSKDKSFALTVDKGNLQDQNYLKKAQDIVMMQEGERAIPEYDKHALTVLATKAGTIVGNSTALSKTNICDRISDGTAALDDGEVESSGRTLFVSAKTYKLLRLSEEFIKVEKLAEKSLTKGYVGRYDDMKVVKVPAGRWPANVNFIIVQKNSATAPQKISEVKIHKDPPGVSGNLIEGRNYYDAFVIGARAVGVYVEVDTSSGKGSVLTAPTINNTSGAISGGSGVTYKYTTDGTDPRYSSTAQTGQPSSPTAGTVIKAYAYKEGAFDSPVAEVVITAGG